MIKKLIIILILTLFNNQLKAEVFQDIKVVGNKRISKSTIIDILQFKKNINYNAEDINEFQKKLFKSDFFKTTKIKSKNNFLVIDVVENPLIDFFFIRGEKNKSRNKKLYEILLLGENKIFSDKNLSLDILKIKKLYKDSGFFDIQVEPKITLLENNLVNVILDINRNNKYFINRIFFNGEKFFSSSVLNDVVSSGEYGWWKFLSTTTTVNMNRIEYDKNLLRNFYFDNGFIDVQILSSDINFKDESKVDLVFSINSGERYNYSNININDETNNLKENDLKIISQLISEKLKGPYSRKSIKLIETKINNYLDINKIEFVRLEIENIKDDSKKNAVTLNFNFLKASSKYINRVNIKGNSITEEKVVRNNLEFSAGDFFSTFKSKKSVDNLKNTGIFENVKINTIPIETDKLDIEVSVEEKPTGSISAGVGAGSSETSVSAGIQEKNLFGKGLGLFGDLSIGTEKISSDINLLIPDYKNTGNELDLNVYSISTDYTNAGYESSKLGNNVSIQYGVYEDVYLKTGIGFEYDKIDVTSSASSTYKSREGSYSTLKSSYTVFTDKRNSRFLPSEGYRVGFGQELGLPGSDISYLSNKVYGNYYHLLSKEYILSFKGGLNSINSLSNSKDVKLSDRKFLTSKNLRGFENYGVGPKDSKDHIGGNYSAYASVASTFPNPFPDKWNAKSIVFFDTGNVWGVDFNDNLDSNKIRSSFGISLDWISPLGPLSFTLSEALSKSNTDVEENFNFQIGTAF